MYRSRGDIALRGVLLLSIASALAITALVGAFLVAETLPFSRELGIARLLHDSSWYPSDANDPEFGMLPMVAGSVVVALGAVALAAPIGIFSSAFCLFYAPPWLATGYAKVIELLSATPSVVFGFWGLTVLVPWMAHFAPPGTSVLSAVLVLALMILPLVVVVAYAALAVAKERYHRPAVGLGLSTGAVVIGVMLPAARRGLYSGVLLQMGRALGETIAVVMVCGNIVRFPWDPLGPTRTLTANIALEMAYATGAHRAALYASGLALLLLVAALTFAAFRCSPTE